MKKSFSYNLPNFFFLNAHVIILAIFSFFFNQLIANKGAFPIDSFFIFDAAYNITLGNHPFKDYWLITGPFLDYIQSFFFIVFGVTWKSYALHASVLNTILSIFSFYLFINIGLKKYYAFIYSLGVAILAYPPIGTPFVDHHSVIFSIMACFSITLAILLKKNFFWFLIPIFLTFSFFSKQIPSPYFVVLFTIITCTIFYFENKINKKILINLALGTIFAFLLVFSIFLINQIPLKNFLVQYIYYPLSLGDERINKLDIDFKNLIGQFKFIYLTLIPLGISLYSLLKIKNKKKFQKKEIIVLLLFLASVAIFIYCQLLTKNQVLIFFLIPICAAYSHAYALKYFNNKYLIYFILIIFVFATAKFHIRFNIDRKFIELVDANFSLVEDPTKLDKRLKGLKWITPHYPNQPLKELNFLKEAKKSILKEKKEKIIITDYQFLNSLIKNKFASPNKWYDGLSVPTRKNKYYKDHKNFFLDKIKKNKIKHIFFVGKNKSEMYFFQELIKENKCIFPNKYNEFFSEFDISKCKF